jgi:hypothetical protein
LFDHLLPCGFACANDLCLDCVKRSACEHRTLELFQVLLCSSSKILQQNYSNQPKRGFHRTRRSHPPLATSTAPSPLIQAVAIHNAMTINSAPHTPIQPNSTPCPTTLLTSILPTYQLWATPRDHGRSVESLSGTVARAAKRTTVRSIGADQPTMTRRRWTTLRSLYLPAEASVRRRAIQLNHGSRT